MNTDLVRPTAEIFSGRTKTLALGLALYLRSILEENGHQLDPRGLSIFKGIFKTIFWGKGIKRAQNLNNKSCLFATD